MGVKLGREAKKKTLVRNGEVGIRQARSPVAKMNQQGAFIFFDQIEGSPRLAMNDARVTEIFPHIRGWLAARYETLVGDILLRVKAQQGLVAAGLVVQEAAQRAQKFARPRQTRRRRTIQIP